MTTPKEYRQHCIATFAVPRYYQGQICQSGYAIKQDRRGLWGVCHADLDQSEPSSSPARFRMGTFASRRRWQHPEQAAHEAHQMAN